MILNKYKISREIGEEAIEQIKNLGLELMRYEDLTEEKRRENDEILRKNPKIKEELDSSNPVIVYKDDPYTRVTIGEFYPVRKTERNMELVRKIEDILFPK